jgi:serine/threonine protein kinase
MRWWPPLADGGLPGRARRVSLDAVVASMRRARQPVLGQRYRLIRQIDAGGMGAVWLAEAVHLRSLVAVKIIDRALAATPEAAARFLNEARTAASLRSPHVVQILDYGVHESTPFIVMELLDGESLSARLKREGRLASWEHTEIVIRHVARALGRAHDAGVTHRDLKPGNIFLVRDEEEEVVKLLDFGIAKSTLSPLGAPLASDTRTGEFLGSPAYASPEQLQASKAIDHRSDIWSLGVIAYECALGSTPFAADGFVAMLLATCVGPLPIPSERGPVPAGFDAWFARACARDVEQRFQSVREASAELRRLVHAARASSAPLSSSHALLPVSNAAPVLAASPAASPEAPTPLTEPMLVIAAPSLRDRGPGALPSRCADTVPLVAAKVRVGPRPSRKALTLMLALPATFALLVSTLGASSSRVALGWERPAPSSGPASGPHVNGAAERNGDALRSDAFVDVATPPTFVQSGLGEAPLKLGSASSIAAPPHAPSSGSPSSGSPSSNIGSSGASAIGRAVAPELDSRAPEPQATPATRHSTPSRVPSAAGSTREESARLTVTATTPVMVSIDGVAVGATPLDAIRIEPGTHEVAFFQNGRRSTDMLTIHSGEHKRIQASIEPSLGDGLDEAAVKRTIKANRDAVVDACMGEALGAWAPGDPTSVRVPISISIDPSGIVRAVDAGAELRGYSALTRCVRERVADWQFPRARAQTVVNVAFVFVRD